MPPRPQFQRLSRCAWNSKLPNHAFFLRAQPSARHASNSSSDPKLHPNPSASPSTDPTSSAPSANPDRTDSPSNDNTYGPGHPSPSAQSNIDPKGPNMEQLPHVSEEAAAMAKSTGEGGPSVEQGTPIQDVLKKDGEAYENLPKVMKDAMKGTGQKRSFHTNARQLSNTSTSSRSGGIGGEALPPSMLGDKAVEQRMQRISDSLDQISKGVEGLGLPSREQQAYPGQYHEITEEEAEQIAKGELPDPLVESVDERVEEVQRQGLKFAPPKTPLGAQRHLHRRYDGCVEQVTNMIMRDGKKSVAQRNVAVILTHLRTTAIKQLSPTGTPRRLLPLPKHTPTASHLPLHPIFYLTFAIDSVAPLMRIQAQRGLAGGGAVLQIPAPLSLRQRRRAAIVWILEACDRRKGGTSGFAKRFAEEIVGIIEGKSTVWSKRENQHRLAVMGRSNLGLVKGGRR